MEFANDLLAIISPFSVVSVVLPVNSIMVLQSICMPPLHKSF